MRFSEPLPQKSHLGLVLRYVPERLERWNFTRRKASRFSTGLYSLVKVRLVEVAFLGQKVVKMCGFRNPCPKRSNPWWEWGNFLDHLFAQCDKGVRGMGNFLDQRGQVLRTFSEIPSAPRLGVTPAGRGEHAWRPAGPACGRGGQFSPEK